MNDNEYLRRLERAGTCSLSKLKNNRLKVAILELGDFCVPCMHTIKHIHCSGWHLELETDSVN